MCFFVKYMVGTPVGIYSKLIFKIVSFCGLLGWLDKIMATPQLIFLNFFRFSRLVLKKFQYNRHVKHKVST